VFAFDVVSHDRSPKSVSSFKFQVENRERPVDSDTPAVTNRQGAKIAKTFKQFIRLGDLGALAVNSDLPHLESRTPNLKLETWNLKLIFRHR
jgi:hypothetical protein